MRESKRKGYRTLGICNNVASTIARESDGGVYMHAGPEIGVAATKSFTSQLIILNLIGLLLGRMRQLSTAQGKQMIDALEALPGQIEQVLKLSDQIESIAKKYIDVNGMLFFGRQFNYPIALEGALKLKEITYLFAEGHPSAELKHGIIALVRPDLPSVFIAPDDAVFSKNVNNIEQVKARKGPIIAITSGNGAKHLKNLAADIVEVPTTIDCLTPGSDSDSAATPGLSSGRRTRPRRRQTAQPRQKRDRGIIRPRLSEISHRRTAACIFEIKARCLNNPAVAGAIRSETRHISSSA